MSTEIVKCVAKPVEFEALQYDGTNNSAVTICSWVIANGQDAYISGSTLDTETLTVVTDDYSEEMAKGEYVVKVRPYKIEIFDEEQFAKYFDVKES